MENADDDDIYDDRERWEVERDRKSAGDDDRNESAGDIVQSLESSISGVRRTLEGTTKLRLPLNWAASEELNNTVWNFYMNKVFNSKVEALQRKVQIVFEDDMEYIKEELESKKLIRDIKYVGSSYENTYIKSHGVEFDVDLILCGEDILIPKNIKKCPGFVTLKPRSDLFQKVSTDYSMSSSPMAALNLINDSLDISPSVIVSGICSELQQIFNESPLKSFVKFPIAHGPALQFDRYNCDCIPKRSECQKDYKGVSPHGKLYSVDVVPAYKLDETEDLSLLYVAKGPKRTGRADIISRAWRRSSALQETARIEQLSEEQRAVLRICKQILFDRSELKKLTTYHLKNAFLTVLLDIEDKFYWTFPNTAQRVMDVWIQIYSFLEEKHMPHVFDSSVNLIENMNDRAITNMINRISGFLENEIEWRTLFVC